MGEMVKQQLTVKDIDCAGTVTCGGFSLTTSTSTTSITIVTAVSSTNSTASTSITITTQTLYFSGGAISNLSTASAATIIDV